MFCRIVVASDGSDHAQDALALALRLRDPDGGRLTLAERDRADLVVVGSSRGSREGQLSFDPGARRR